MQDLRGLLSFSLFACGTVRRCLDPYIVGTKMYQPLVQIHVLAPQFNTPAAQACPNPYIVAKKTTCRLSGSVLLSAAGPDPYIVESKNICRLSGSVLLSAAGPDPYIVEYKNTCRLSGSVYCGIKKYLPLVRIRILWHKKIPAACPDPYYYLPLVRIRIIIICRLSGSVYCGIIMYLPLVRICVLNVSTVFLSQNVTPF